MKIFDFEFSGVSADLSIKISSVEGFIYITMPAPACDEWGSKTISAGIHKSATRSEVAQSLYLLGALTVPKAVEAVCGWDYNTRVDSNLQRNTTSKFNWNLFLLKKLTYSEKVQVHNFAINVGVEIPRCTLHQ